MNLKTVFSAVAMIAALHSGHASAIDLQQLPLTDHVQIDPGVWQRLDILPATVQGKGCTFYEHANGEGESWHKEVGWLAQRYADQDSYAENVTTVGEWWNDRISSLQCDETANIHCSVDIHPDINRQGGEAILYASQGLVNLEDIGWNDTVSSFQIFCNVMH